MDTDHPPLLSAPQPLADVQLDIAARLASTLGSASTTSKDAPWELPTKT
jgi:hypothetical protein